MTLILILLFGFVPGAAVGTDLLYACVTKTVGVLPHGFNNTVDWRLVLSVGSLVSSALTLAVLWCSAGALGATPLIMLYPELAASRITGSDIARGVCPAAGIGDVLRMF